MCAQVSKGLTMGRQPTWTACVAFSILSFLIGFAVSGANNGETLGPENPGVPREPQPTPTSDPSAPAKAKVDLENAPMVNEWEDPGVGPSAGKPQRREETNFGTLVSLAFVEGRASAKELDSYYTAEGYDKEHRAHILRVLSRGRENYNDPNYRKRVEEMMQAYELGAKGSGEQSEGTLERARAVRLAMYVYSKER